MPDICSAALAREREGREKKKTDPTQAAHEILQILWQDGPDMVHAVNETLDYKIIFLLNGEELNEKE
mgnify:FL=1